MYLTSGTGSNNSPPHDGGLQMWSSGSLATDEYGTSGKSGVLPAFQRIAAPQFSTSSPSVSTRTTPYSIPTYGTQVSFITFN